MTRARRVEGVVLQVRNFGEAHRIVEALTPEDGRVTAVARNARASRRRFAGVLDLFATLELQVVPGPDLWRLDAASLQSARLGLREDLERLGRAGLCCEAVRLLVPEHHEASVVYHALGRALDRLERGELVAAAELFPVLFAAAGISPELGRCARCGRPPARVAGVDPRGGGVLCTACAPHAAPLPPAAAAVLAGRPCPDDATARAVEACAVAWLEVQTGRALKTRGVVLPPRGA